MEAAVTIVFFKPRASDLLISLKNISKFSVALIVWNSNPIELESLAKDNNIDLSNTKIYILINKGNLGIGGGLNTALKFANKLELNFVLALDQDSLIIMDKDKILKYFQKLADIPKLGCLGFKRKKGKYENMQFSNKSYFNSENHRQLKNFQNGSLLNYSYMHSGSVYCIKTFIDLGGFKQEYFMGITDTEYSLRLNRKNYKLLYVDDFLMIHDAGSLDKNNNNNFFLFHPLWIHYLEYRNFLVTLFENFIFSPRWALKSTVIFLTFIPIKILIMHKSFLRLIMVIFCGISDGIISIFLNKISSVTYKLILERSLKFKIPLVEKFS